MKVVFMISPDFLSSAFKEAEKYSFELQGYGNFEMACKRLAYVNAADLLGFVYICKTPNGVGTKEYKAMLEFFHLCDLIGADKKFLMVSQGSFSDYLSDLRKFKHVRFALLQNVEFITDTLLNRDVFGSILLDNYEPYIFKKEKPISLGDYTCPTLEWKGIVPPALFDVEEKVRPLENLEDTLENDLVMQRYKENPLICKLREAVIRKSTGEEWNNTLKEFDKMLDGLDNKQLGIYLAYSRIVLGGREW